MQYVKVTNGQAEKYTIGQLRRDNPRTSFPKMIPDETLASFNVYPVVREISQPAYNPTTEYIEKVYTFIQGEGYVQTWQISSYDSDEAAQRINLNKKEIEKEKTYQMLEQAWPTFMKWKRGEATEKDWLEELEIIEEWYK
jgi:hypothetical protein